MGQKKIVRAEWLKKLAQVNISPYWGKIAEKIRKTIIYRDAKTVFATPHDSLHQVRTNCLADGKNLLMPGPGIREGFFLLKARSVPFKNISLAVTYKGLEKYGQPLKDSSISELQTDLLLTDSLVIDRKGGRIGDGYGFFDLSCALLQSLNGIRHDANILTVVHEDQLSQEILPQDIWDIKITGAVTQHQILHFEPSSQIAKIFLDVLPYDRVKNIDPLWKLYQKKQVRSKE